MGPVRSCADTGDDGSEAPMPQVEPSVLGALMEAAEDAVSYEAIAVMLAAADIDTTTAAAQQRDALLAALRLRLSGTGKAQGFTGTLPGDPLKGRSASLTEVTPDQLEIWSAYADAVSNSFVRGRLHHLLLAAGHGRKPDRARGAAAGYLDAAPLLLAAPERLPGLVRATECLRWAWPRNCMPCSSSTSWCRSPAPGRRRHTRTPRHSTPTAYPSRSPCGPWSAPSAGQHRRHGFCTTR